MSKKYVYFITLLILVLFIASSCIMVVPRSSNSGNNSGSSKPNTIKGKFLVKASKTTVTLRDNSGNMYELTGVSKSDQARFVKLNGDWVGVEIQPLSKGKAKIRKARFIRFL